MYKYNACNYNTLRNSIQSTDWQNRFDPNIDIFIQTFTDTLSSIINKYVPLKLVRINPSDKPWVNRDIKQLIRTRKRKRFRRLRNSTIMTIRNSKSAYYTKLSERLISNHNSSKDWWKTLKEYMCPNRKETIPNLINPVTNEPTTTDFEKAECLNDFFVRQTRIDVDDNTSGPFDDVQDANNMHRIDEIRLNDMEVKYVLLSLDPGKATGPDGISNKHTTGMCLRIGITTLTSFQCFSVFYHCTLFLETRHCLCCPRKKMTNHVPPTTDQFLCYVVWKRYLSD